MFDGFTKQTADFFWELAFHNERPWFLAHKEQFERFVNAPFKALAHDVYEELGRRVPDGEFSVHLSRIYRDARRLFGRGPYKDHLWFSVTPAEAQRDGPTLWFEISPSEYSYGCGFYGATPAQMEAFRRSIDANPARFLRLAKAMQRAGWSVDGPSYARPKKKLADPLLNAWYNLKWAGLSKSFDWGEAGYAPDLPQAVAEAFAQLMPMLRYFMDVYLSCPGETDRAR